MSELALELSKVDSVHLDSLKADVVHFEAQRKKSLAAKDAIHTELQSAKDDEANAKKLVDNTLKDVAALEASGNPLGAYLLAYKDFVDAADRRNELVRLENEISARWVDASAQHSKCLDVLADLRAEYESGDPDDRPAQKIALDNAQGNADAQETVVGEIQDELADAEDLRVAAEDLVADLEFRCTDLYAKLDPNDPATKKFMKSAEAFGALMLQRAEVARRFREKRVALADYQATVRRGQATGKTVEERYAEMRVWEKDYRTKAAHTDSLARRERVDAREHARAIEERKAAYEEYQRYRKEWLDAKKVVEGEQRHEQSLIREIKRIEQELEAASQTVRNVKKTLLDSLEAQLGTFGPEEQQRQARLEKLGQTLLSARQDHATHAARVKRLDLDLHDQEQLSVFALARISAANATITAIEGSEVHATLDEITEVLSKDISSRADVVPLEKRLNALAGQLGRQMQDDRKDMESSSAVQSRGETLARAKRVVENLALVAQNNTR